MRLIVFFVVAVLFGVGIGGLLFSLATPVERRVLEASIFVAEHVGFDLNDSALTFGTTVPGQVQERAFFVHNFNDFSVVVRLFARGDLAEFLRLSNTSFVLSPGESEQVFASVFLPENVSYGFINGSVESVMWRNW